MFVEHLHPLHQIETALPAFTINSAYVNGIDDVSGSIAVGKLADLIILNRNLFEIPIKKLSETEVLLTLFGGQPVHGSFSLLE